MALLASPHFILMRYNSSCRYWPITSSHGPQRLINFSLDHVISRLLFMITTIYHTAMALLPSIHFILTRYNSSCRYWPITSSHGPQRLINFSLDHVIPRLLFMITTIYHTAMALLPSIHFILMRYNSSCRYWPITSSHGPQRIINFFSGPCDPTSVTYDRCQTAANDCLNLCCGLSPFLSLTEDTALLSVSLWKV